MRAIASVSCDQVHNGLHATMRERPVAFSTATLVQQQVFTERGSTIWLVGYTKRRSWDWLGREQSSC